MIIGIFAEVYLVDDDIIRKISHDQSEESMQSIIREAMIYDIVRTDKRIAEWLSSGISDYVDIQYYPHGEPVKYCQENSITPELRYTLPMTGIPRPNRILLKRLFTFEVNMQYRVGLLGRLNFLGLLVK